MRSQLLSMECFEKLDVRGCECDLQECFLLVVAFLVVVVVVCVIEIAFVAFRIVVLQVHVD